MQRRTYTADELIKLGEAFPWPERPAIGAEVQLNSGSPRWVIVAYDGEVAMLTSDDGARYEFNYRMLRPWKMH